MAGDRNPSFRGWASRDKVAYRRRFEERYPDKAAAHRAVSQAVYDGRLVRRPCEICGDPASHAHHESYAPDRRLDVRWLCRAHHRDWHALDRPERGGLPFLWRGRWRR